MLFKLSYRAPQMRHYTSAVRGEGGGLWPWLPRWKPPEHCAVQWASAAVPLPLGAKVAPLTEDAHEGGSKLCSTVTFCPVSHSSLHVPY